MKIDILAFGAHPDDIELSCCGTLIKHMEAGYTAPMILREFSASINLNSPLPLLPNSPCVKSWVL